MTKTVDDDTPTQNQQVVFTITVANNGTIGATGVEVTDLLPAGLTFVSATPSLGTYVQGTGIWTVGAIAAGADETLTITATATGSGTLTIRGERRSEARNEQSGYSRVERSHGTFHRRFALPDTANAEGITASGQHGVLAISIPKRPEVKARRINVNA